MSVPSREALLKELDSLGYGARTARVARLGREAPGTPELARLLSELEAGDAYEACLALDVAQAARDEAVLVRGLTHPSCQVSSRAAALAGDFIQDDVALERVLPELSPHVRRRVLKGVALADRRALATRLVPQVLARHGAAEAALLVPALEEDGVRRLLLELGHAVPFARTLLNRHSGAVMGFLQERFHAAPERERPSLFARYGHVLATLTLSHAEAVLALVRELAPPDTLPQAVAGALPRLTRRHPAQVFALLTRPAFRPKLLAEGLPRGLPRQVDAFSDEQHRALARALAEAPHHLGTFLAALPPSRRAALFTHAFAGAPPRVLPESLLAVLPHGQRDAEAARQLELREVRENPELKLATQALRAIEHAREPLQKAAFASKAEDRARALVLLVRATGLSRRGLDETLAHLARLKNEQDPVRQAVLGELSRLPLSLFQEAHLPALRELVRYVVEARDTSRGTQAALQGLAFRLVRGHATAPEGALFRFALETLKRLAGQSEVLALPPLEKDLPRGAEHHLVAALLPMIRAANQRESHGLVLVLAQALGRRAWGVDMLQALLEPVTEATPDFVARSAIELWLAPPRTRDGRIRRLLDKDETVIIFPRVFEHLHRRRQEWLDPFLEGRRLRGRFSSGKTGWVPAVRSGFHRWLPRQQAKLRELLLRVARDTERSAWERMSVLFTLPRLHGVTADTLKPFLDSQDVPTVEAALGALAWMDEPAPALPLLLEHLEGDRARVAMYAVPRVARLVRPEVLSSALETLLGRERLKVTVHKEAVRLLGAFRSPRSLGLLRRQWERPQLHRDVRIALGHAARRLLDEEAAWELLGAMARGADSDVAASLLDQAPDALPPEQRPRYAALLLEVARHPEAKVRRDTFTRLPDWSAGLESQVAAAARARVEDVSSGTEWRAALQALVQTVRDGRAFEQVVDCARALREAPIPEEQDATPERDRPTRQRLQALCEALVELPRPVRLRLRPRLREVAEALAVEPPLWPLTAALRLSSQEWRDASEATEALRTLSDEVRDEPLFAPALASAVAVAASHPAAEAPPETLLEVADALASATPLLAVALVSVAGQRLHWREDAARRLRALRQHPRPAVRAAACAVRTASE